MNAIEMNAIDRVLNFIEAAEPRIIEAEQRQIAAWRHIGVKGTAIGVTAGTAAGVVTAADGVVTPVGRGIPDAPPKPLPPLPALQSALTAVGRGISDAPPALQPPPALQSAPVAVGRGILDAPLVPPEPPLLLSANPSPELTEGLFSHSPKAIHFDSEKMFVNGLLDALRAVCGGADAVPSMRANMGCSIFPSLLGVAPRLFDDKMPWVKDHLTREQVAALDPGDIKIEGEFSTALAHMEYMVDKIGGSPIHIYPPDLQGPFDTAHIVYGDAIFYELYDDPKLVHHLMDVCCEALIRGMELSLALIPGSAKMVAHYNNLIIPREMGGIKLSEDTSTLLSPDTIDEFVMPYTRRVLDHFDGGYIHYCGRNDHLLDVLLDTGNVYGINFGNPDKHDMDAILRRIADAGKLYYGQVDRLQGETDAAFFKRVRAASRDRLLLTVDAGECDTDVSVGVGVGVSVGEGVGVSVGAYGDGSGMGSSGASRMPRPTVSKGTNGYVSCYDTARIMRDWEMAAPQ